MVVVPFRHLWIAAQLKVRAAIITLDFRLTIHSIASARELDFPVILLEPARNELDMRPQVYLHSHLYGRRIDLRPGEGYNLGWGPVPGLGAIRAVVYNFGHWRLSNPSIFLDIFK